MNFEKLRDVFNKFDETRQMYDWDHYKGAWNSTVVAKLEVSEKYKGATWLPYNLNLLTEEDFAIILYKFLSAYPERTSLHYSGANIITDHAFFFVILDKTK